MITLGIEEEVQVVDDLGQLVTHDFSDGLSAYDIADGQLDKEIHRCVIELKTRVCSSVPELVSALRAMRAQARRRAQTQGQRILIAGMHPTALWQQQPMHEGAAYAHYSQLIDEYQDVARSAFSFGMHLHLGFDPGAPRMAIMNRLRHVLPEALALSASSPFFEGRDTGLQSWRHSLLDRYPRMGTPDIWASEQAYTAHVQRLRQVGCLHEDQGLWQDLRLHHRYGTLEIRIMDTHPDLARIGLIATLLKWEAETLELEIRAGRQAPAWPRACIDENKWRARRHGLQAAWIAWDHDEVRSTATHFERWWARIAGRAADASERDYWERQLADALGQGTYADALRRRVHADADWHATLQWMAAQSLDDTPGAAPLGSIAKSAWPQLRLEYMGSERLAHALDEVGAPHLPQSMMSDHYAVGNAPLRQVLDAKIRHLVEALAPQLHPTRTLWLGARADVLALDLAFVEHPRQPFDLAWVEIQAFTSMLPTFHTLHLAQRRVHGLDANWLPHDILPSRIDWVEHLRQWVAPPHAATVLIEDRPLARATWADLDAARHWWQVAVHDWRDLAPDHGFLWCPGTSRRYTHVWNRLIFSDLPPLDRIHAEALLLAANRLSWHSHPAWYDGIHKGSLADVPLAAHEACHWIEDSPLRAAQWSGADQWVAKSVGGHSGSGLLLAPTAEELQALPTPRQWIVQNKFRQVPIGQHPVTRQPLFGEVRCMLGLRENQPPWVMAWILRCSTNGVATLTGRRTQPGEGMTMLYFDSEGR